MEKVLIIEDNHSFSYQLATILKHSGFESHIEDTCEDGLSYFKENEEDVDLILLDINLEEKECGLNVLKKIRSMSSIWIGVMTYDETIAKERITGQSAFIKKHSTSINELIDHLKMLSKYNSFSRNKTIKTGSECNLELIDDNYFSINSVRLKLPPLPYKILHMLYTKPEVGKEAGVPSDTYSARHIQGYLNQSNVFETVNIRVHIKTIRDKINEIAPGCGIKIIDNDPGFGYRCTYSHSPTKKP